MANFNLPMPNIPSAKVSNGGADLGAIKLQMGQMYNARLETLSNQVSQVRINVGQQTVTQPLPQLPANMTNQARSGQNVQVSVSVDKNGQAVLNFHPQDAKVGAVNTQQMKINLTDAQLVNLLSLNKNFQVKADGQIQTQGQLINQGAGKTPSLQLPGLNNAIKLPEGLASALRGAKSVDVAISVKNGKIEMSLTPPGSKNQAQAVKLPLTADKVAAIVKETIAKNPQLPLQTDAKANAPSKITLPNNQILQLPSKVNPQAQSKLAGLNQKQLAVNVLTPVDAKNASQSQQPATNAKVLATVTLDKGATVAALKAENLSQTDSGKSAQAPKVQLQVGLEQVKISNDKSLTGQLDTKQAQQSNNVLANQAANTPELRQLQLEQKQALNKLIDPLIRILLPKKVSWNEGLKNLDQIAKQLPDVKAPLTDNAIDTEQTPELKQVLNQLRSSIPDQNSPLTDKQMAAIIGSALNFSPTKVVSSPQPTPANAIASALQLLLGAKTVQTQSDAKLTPQIVQQLTALIKNQTGKEDKSGKGVKAMTTNLAQAEQSSGSLKSLVGISSTMRNQQLENVEKKLDGNPQLNVTLPLKVDDEIKELQLSINEDEENSDKDNRKVSVWQLNLTFDLGELGRMLVNAKLKDGEVSMQMYAEKPGALTQIKKFTATLEERLEFHGVKIKQMQSSLGKINEGQGNKKLTSLLQIKV